MGSLQSDVTVFAIGKRSFYCLFFACLFSVAVQAQQGYVQRSHLFGANTPAPNNPNTFLRETPNKIIATSDGGHLIVGSTTGSDFPVTNGTTYSGGSSDVFAVKFDANDDLVFGTYLGGSDTEPANSQVNVIEDNGQIHVFGLTESGDFPVTAGTYSGPGAFVTTMDLDGTILSSIVINDGFLTNNFGTNVARLAMKDGVLYITERTITDIGFPATDGSSVSGDADIRLSAYALTGNLLHRTYYGGIGREVLGSLFLDGDKVYLAGTTTSGDLPVTNGSTINPTQSSGVPSDGFLAVFDGSTLSLGMATYFGGSEVSLQPRIIEVIQGKIFLAASTNSGFGAAIKDYPITTGTPPPPTVSFLGGDDYLTIFDDTSGMMEYSAYMQSNVRSYSYHDEINAFVSTAISTTTGFGFSRETELIRLNGQNIPISRTVLTENSVQESPSECVYDVISNQMVIAIHPDTNTYRPLVISPNTTPTTIIYIGLVKNDGHLFIVGRDVSVATNPNQVLFFATDNGALQKAPPSIGGFNIFFAHYNLCPTFPNTNTIFSPVQNICQGATGNVLDANPIFLQGESLPVLYDLRGNTTQQGDVSISGYQWQIADSSTGPWTDIAGARFEDYIPTEQSTDKFYRRAALNNVCCSPEVLSYSNVAEIRVTSDVAQEINAGGILYGCVGQPIALGGSPTVVSGGVAPFTYTWDNLDLLDDVTETTANPIASVTETTVFTLIVTDANGCRSIDQVVVNIPEATPIPGMSTCSGDSIIVGNLPPQGATDVTYHWTFDDDSPVNDGSLSCTDCAQPVATVLTTTDYKITVTLNTGTPYQCTFSQLVTVDYVAPPSTPDFAGSDLVLCLGDSGTLGTPAENGWTYNWAPVNFLDDAGSAQPTVNFSQAMPSPNPYTFYLTASKDGCSFTDEVNVAVIDPYITDEPSPVCIAASGSGYRTTFGQPDQTPNLNETYLWEVLPGGTATIIGATDRSIVELVGPNDNSTSTLRLTVSYNGTACVEEMEVTATCVACDVDISVDSDFGCPSTQGGHPLKLSAEIVNPAGADLSNYSFSWSPQEGLSNYDQRTVEVLDAVERTYTVTVTDIRNGNFCTQDVDVNDPAWSAPTFVPPFEEITVCPTDPPFSIGQPPVTGYSYLWVLTEEQSVFSTDSNPSVDPSTLPALVNTFVVTVTDTVSGCKTTEVVTVHLAVANVNAGEDIFVCGDAIVQLGHPPVAGYTYSWEPSTANFQNGTGANDAQPEVLFASTFDQTFTLTATSPEGCVIVDEMLIRFTGDPDATLGVFPNPTICLGQNQEIGLPGLHQVMYSWSVLGGDTASLLPEDVKQAQPEVAPTTTTVYRLLADFPGDCGDPIERLVTVTVASETFSMTDETYCPFPLGNTVTIGDDPSIPTGPNYRYAWSGPLVNGNSAQSIAVSPNSETRYRLTVTNTATGCEHSEWVTVTPNTDLPKVGPIQRTVCLGESISLGNSTNILHNPPTTIVSWSPTTNLDDASSITPTFTPSITGTFTYTLSITDNGCENQNTVTIEVVDPPVIPDMDPQSVCTGASTVIGVDALPGISYSWTPVTNLADPNSAQTLVTSVTEGIEYTLTAIDIATGCSSQKSVTIGVSQASAPILSIPDLVFCLDGGPQTMVPSISPASTGSNYSFQWEVVSGETFTTIDDRLMENPTIAPFDVGTTLYRLYVTDLDSGCTAIAEAQATVNAVSSVVNPGDLQICRATYELPLISGHNLNPLIAYFDGPNGTGNRYRPGDIISSDRTLYIYDPASPDCSNEERFSVSFVTPPQLSLVDLSCAEDELTYDIDFVSDGSVIAESSPAGTPLSIAGNRITGIPAGVDVLLRATRGNCVSNLLVSAPDCATFDQCRPVELPLVYTGVIQNETDRTISEGEAIRVNSDVTVTGDLTMTGGLLHIADGATLTVTGNFNLLGGAVFLTECGVLNNGGSFNCQGGSIRAYCDTFDPDSGERLVENPSNYTTSDGDYVPLTFGVNTGSACTVDMFACPRVGDYGDALHFGDAQHHVPILAILYLGTTAPDAENTTLNSIAADGDDGDAPEDDEDGISALPTLNSSMTSYSVTVEVTNIANSDATLIGWIDFDLSGTFDRDEAAWVTGNLQGSQLLHWNGTIPNDITPGTAYARFRISDDPLTADDSGTSASNGEVEDYLVPILPGNTVSAKNDINQTPQQIAVNGNILTNDYDLENDEFAILTIAGLDASGAPLTIPTDGTPVRIYDPNGSEAGTIAFAADGAYTYVPASGYFGAAILNYDIIDDQVDPAIDSATLTIKVIPDLLPLGNNPPLAQDDTATLEQGDSVQVMLLANDSDPDGDELHLNSAMGFDANGNLFDLTSLRTDIYDSDGTLTGQAGLSSDGTVVFTASPVFTGDVPIFYTIADAMGLEDSAIAIFSVEPRDTMDNDTYANDDANSAQMGVSQMGNVLSNDYDPEGNTQALSGAKDANGEAIELGVETVLPNGGVVTLRSNGDYVYLPPADFYGTEMLTYTVCDDVILNPPGQSCESATLYLTTLFRPSPSLRVVKTAEIVGPSLGAEINTDEYNIRYVLNVTNSGELVLTELSLIDDLNNAFPAPMSFSATLVNTPVTTNAGNTITLNTAYNGSTDTELLAAGNFLAPSEAFEIILDVHVRANCHFGMVTNVAQASGNAPNNERVTALSNVAGTESASVTFAESALFIPEGFSPNGDGNHDTFTIERPSCMELTLECYNRWGNMVWTSKGATYQNNWDGTANTGLHLGEQLPDGTYYWIMKIKNSSGENTNKSGYVTLMR